MSDWQATFRAAAGVAQQEINSWATLQAPRRNAEYQEAVSYIRDQYDLLMHDLSTTPSYETHQTMYDERTQAIQQAVLDGSFNNSGKPMDIVVRRTFDAAWHGIEQAAQDQARGISRAMQREDLDVRYVKLVDDAISSSGSIDEAFARWRDIMTYATGAATGAIDRIGEEMTEIVEQGFGMVWSPQRAREVERYFINGMRARMTSDLSNLIEAGDRDGVVLTLEQAMKNGVLANREEHEDVLTESLYRIDVQEATSTVMAMAIQDADAAAAFIADPQNFENLKPSDRDEIFRSAIWYSEREEMLRQRRIAEDDRVAQEYLSEVEANILNGQDGFSWQAGIDMITENTEAGRTLRAKLVSRGQNYWVDRWTRFALEVIKPGEEVFFADDGRRADAMEEVRQMIRGREDENLIDLLIHQYALPDASGIRVFRPEDTAKLRTELGNIDKPLSPGQRMVEAALEQYDGDLAADEREMIKQRLLDAERSFLYRPDGSLETDEFKIMQTLRNAVAAWADATKAQTVNAEMVALETLYSGTRWEASNNRAQEQLTSEIDSLLHTGTQNGKFIMTAVLSGLTDDDALKTEYLLSTGAIEDRMTDNEKRIMENNIQFAKLATAQARLYHQQFGRAPRITPEGSMIPSEVINLFEGGVAFVTPDNKVVRLAYDEDVADERWYEFDPQRSTWIPSQDLNRPPTPLYSELDDKGTSLTDEQIEAARGTGVTGGPLADIADAVTRVMVPDLSAQRRNAWAASAGITQWLEDNPSSFAVPMMRSVRNKLRQPNSRVSSSDLSIFRTYGISISEITDDEIQSELDSIQGR